ncbi:hypothetical protein [Ruminococcus sp.]|uniref:hypothetical protein n=1 Tax=Ruminococcus sp. TaxID=41978 RepID=UPI0025EBC09B|nr:hypothetical protein [Ruminococcus sp.]
MNEKILRHKSVLAFADAAKTVERYAAKKVVVLTRMYAVSLIDSFIAASDKADSFSRRIRKRGAHLPEWGLQIAVVNPYAEQKRKLHGMLVTTGEMLFYALYIWQQAGGTFQELCNLCNISEEYGRKSMEGIDGDTFPSILFVCALDYKDTGDWIECTPDAPMTICIKEYMLDQLIHTKHGQRAAHEALGKVFPNLEGHAIYRIVDNEGNVHYVDNDGAELPLTEK